MDYYSISALLNLVIQFWLGTFVYLKDKQKGQNRAFALLCYTVVVWSLSDFLLAIRLPLDESTYLYIVKFLHIAIIFFPSAFVKLSFAITNESPKRYFRYFLNYFPILLWFITLFTPFMLESLAIEETKFYSRYFPRAGVLYNLVSVFTLWSIGYWFYRLIHNYKRTTGYKRNQIKYFLLASSVGLLSIPIAFLNTFGIEIPPLDNYIAILYFLIIAYAISKHRLMNIDVVVKKGVTDILLFFAMGIISLFVLFGIEKYSHSVAFKNFVIILLIILFSYLFRRLKPVAEKKVEKAMFGNKYEYLYTLGTISSQWFTVLSLHKFLERMVSDIAQAMRLKCCSFILFNEDGGYYEIGASTEIGQEIDIKHFRISTCDPLISYLNRKKSIIIKEELKAGSDLAVDEQVSILKEMRQLNAEICIPFTIENQLMGILTVGAKPNNEMYNQDDIEILNWLVERGKIMFSYTIHNYKQLQLVSRYAHDLGNPLGNAKAYFLLLEGNLKDEESRKNFASMKKNINFVDECVQNMRESSRIDYEQIASQIKTEEIELEQLISEVVQSLEVVAKGKNISLTCNMGKELPRKVYADRNRLERLIRNLIQNSLKFTEKGKIEIKIGQEDKNLKIIVADTGKGIPKENLPKIFEPFFKIEGSGIVGGMGLGLNIVKKIVELYKGKILVKSELGEGTSFTILMPILEKPILT